MCTTQTRTKLVYIHNEIIFKFVIYTKCLVRPIQGTENVIDPTYLFPCFGDHSREKKIRGRI